MDIGVNHVGPLLRRVLLAAPILVTGCGTSVAPPGGDGPTCVSVRSASIELASSSWPTVEFDGRSYYWHGQGVIFATASEVTALGAATCIPESGVVSPIVYALVGIDPDTVIVLESEPPSELPAEAAIPPGTSPYGLFLRDGRSEGPPGICRFYLPDSGPSECAGQTRLHVPWPSPARSPHAGAAVAPRQTSTDAAGW